MGHGLLVGQALCPPSCGKASHTTAGLPLSQSSGGTESPGVGEGDVATMAAASLCQHPRHTQECLHTPSDSTQSGGCSGHTLFLGCALGQKQTHHARLCESNRKRPLCACHSKHIKKTHYPSETEQDSQLGTGGDSGCSALGDRNPLLDSLEPHPGLGLQWHTQ